MLERPPVYYWDTCIFLEHIKEEPVDPACRRAILRLLEDNRDRKNRIVTSTITHAEALPTKLTAFDAEKEDQYWSYFNGIYFADHEVSRQVIALARHIRDYYYRAKNIEAGTPYRMLGLGDSIHLATAIVIEADEFHTRDKNGSGGNIGLLRLLDLTENRKVAGQWPLNILSPKDPQGNILDPLLPQMAVRTKSPDLGKQPGD
jgi:predicted nucleic acid-binding protein